MSCKAVCARFSDGIFWDSGLDPQYGSGEPLTIILKLKCLSPVEYRTQALTAA